MSTLAVVIACWLGINVAFVALKLYHARSHVHAVDTSPNLSNTPSFTYISNPDPGNLIN
jgi:hypothetical protein